MATFEWVCKECLIYWDREYKAGKAPKKTRCPKCKKLCEKYWENSNIGISFGDDGIGNKGNGAMDFHTVKRRYQKHAEKGYDKDSANRFLRQSIEKTKARMDNESFRYVSANVKWDKLAKDRGLKKVSEKEAEQKVKNAKKLTKEAYDRANKMGYKDIDSNKLDITKPQKQQ